MMMLGFLKPTSGTIRYKGDDIYQLRGDNFARFRHEVQAVFQNPFETFNPFYKIDRLLHLATRKFSLAKSQGDASSLIERALRLVDLDPSYVLGRYPHELSGGQLQRISIARCFMIKPALLIADEPVSMIDASLRIRVLRHLLRLKQEQGTTIVYITHDLSTALQISDEVLIAYKGSIVEKGPAANVIQTPSHDYTRRLIAAIPVPDPSIRWERATTDLWRDPPD
jgi:peptide/nickel transport system ATP-binding protein